MERLPILALGAATAFALTSTTLSAQDDPRLVTRAYDAAKIVRIEGKPGVQATIVFGEDEKIENVAVGDSEKWQITPNKRANLLFARPLDAAAVTNMTVVTDKRTYLFDLVATAKDKPVYLLRFTYGAVSGVMPSGEPAQVTEPTVVAASPPVPVNPTVASIVASDSLASRPPEAIPAAAPEPETQIAVAVPASSAIDDAIAASSGVNEVSAGQMSEIDVPQQEPDVATAEYVPAARPVLMEEPGALNFAWAGEGKSSLLPRRIYDDGMATYLIWGKNQKVPTVTVTDANGVESTPRLTSENNSISLAGVPPMIVLRQGKSSATLENLRPIKIAPLPVRQLSAQAGGTSPSPRSN